VIFVIDYLARRCWSFFPHIPPLLAFFGQDFYTPKIKSYSMGKYTLVVETEDGRSLKIDGAEIDQENIPADGGIIRFKAKRIIEIKRD
jgi:hypothetical protein